VNLRDARIVLRPRGVGDMLDLALRACLTVHRALFLRLTALTLLPLALMLIAAHRWLHVSWLGAYLVAMLLAAPLSGLYTIAAGQLLFSEAVPLAEVFRRWRRRLGALVGMLIVWRGVVLLPVVTYLLVLQRPFVYEATLLEGASVGRTYRRAGQLAARRPGYTFWLGLLLALAPLVAALYGQLLVTTTLSYVLMVPTPESWVSGDTPFLMLGALFAMPYVACARLIGYIDARTRIEGWDVQLRFTAVLQAEAEAEAPAARRASN
jgi:hypothetical protein